MAYPNWFELVQAQLLFERFLLRFSGEPLRALQIGVFTGDASVWLLENVLTHPDARLVDVDTWQGSEEEEHRTFDWTDVEKAYRNAVGPYLGKVNIVKSRSNEFFRENSDLFDFIYVDGDHTAAGVLSDAVSAMNVLKPGGILAFDDYLWGNGLPDSRRPQKAIDAFLMAFDPHIEVLFKGHQVWITRTDVLEAKV